MNKLVYGVGTNDLGYKVHVREDVTEDGGKRVRKTVFRCKYYAAWKNMLERCYSKKIPRKLPNIYRHERLSRVVVCYSI